MTAPLTDHVLTGRPADAAEAKEALDRLLDTLPSCSPSARSDALLAVSELVSAAQRHGIDVSSVTARTGDDWVDLSFAYAPQPQGEQVEAALTDGWAWTIAASVADKLDVSSTSSQGLRVRLLLRM
ncbi:hypothetical protein ABII15_02165 [Streptomyces sp. HUAS MG91]|uniref:ATP-binding protein n=1 Tax=Streptomyces tabacisoli TaxID=3156398 RepID=A0AAU8IKS2_9ACTN